MNLFIQTMLISSTIHTSMVMAQSNIFNCGMQYSRKGKNQLEPSLVYRKDLLTTSLTHTNVSNVRWMRNKAGGCAHVGVLTLDNMPIFETLLWK